MGNTSSDGQTQKRFFLVVVIIIVSVAALKLIPIPVKEELVNQTFSFDNYGVARTTLNIREKATVSGTYSGTPTSSACSFSIQIIGPDQETIIWEESCSSSGSFRFIADVRGSYYVIIQNGLPDEIKVQFTVTQSYKKTLI